MAAAIAEHMPALEQKDAKEGMRFGAGAQHAASRGSGQTRPAAGSRAHIGWFGVTVASFERGDVRQSPNGIYIYDDAGRREVEVFGGRGTVLGSLIGALLHNCVPVFADIDDTFTLDPSDVEPH